MSPALRTARLLLKPYVPQDEDAFVRLFGDEAVTRWMGMPDVDARTLFRRAFLPGNTVTWDIWAVWEGETYVGHAEIKPSPNAQVDGHEIVYALVPEAWGRGLGGEVAEAVTAHGLETLGLDAVHATVDPDNSASLALLRRLGYEDVRDLVDDETGEVSRMLTVSSRR
ncbi:GNAT family N-acetyltransferase [Sphaerisporangium fuscum]|uniref:GNAT family N-acetyltransferase n=1 Tax=Sphaerisporangium fuscum TaxID=2835868 RepID=UPI001BDDC6A0|nr:GNAT family N-acetyltransferase [Sphaerisporangium fuscum]